MLYESNGVGVELAASSTGSMLDLVKSVERRWHGKYPTLADAMVNPLLAKVGDKHITRAHARALAARMLDRHVGHNWRHIPSNRHTVDVVVSCLVESRKYVCGCWMCSK